MVRPSTIVAAVIVAAAIASEARADGCEVPVKPGVSIGRLKLGMTLAQAKQLGKLERLEQPAGAWQLKTDGVSLRLTLDKDKHVDSIRLASEKPCLVEGTGERYLDMHDDDTRVRSPLPDCGRNESMIWRSWTCPTHGVEIAWEGEALKPMVVVRAPGEASPYSGAPPIPPWRVQPACVAHPHPQVGCAFFGRSLTLECYPTNPCMGSFVQNAPDHLDAHSGDGAYLGKFKLSRNGQSLALRFATPPKTGSVVRILADRELKTSWDEDVVNASRPVVALVGGRDITNGYVLELEVPEPPKCTLVFEGRCFDSEAALCAAKACPKERCTVAKADAGVQFSCAAADAKP